MGAATRRTLVKALPVVAAVSISACAPSALAGEHPDAELLKLGAEFSALYAEWRPIWHEEGRLSALAKLKLASRTCPTDEDRFAAWETISRDIGLDAAADRNDALVDRLNAIFARIMALPPTTIGGLAVWARAAKFNGMDAGLLDLPVSELDWEQEFFGKLVEQIERMARAA